MMQKKKLRQASLYCWQRERFWVAAEKVAQQGMILFPMLPEMRLRLLRKRKQRRTDVHPGNHHSDTLDKNDGCE